MAVKIQFRRDTAANWQSVNPILSQGELGLDTTNNRFKMGNGSTTWNDLAYTVDFEPNGTYPDLRAQATTKEDVGLGNVTNDAQVKRSEMGQPDGVATLDSSGLIPSTQLPSFVDDVLEFVDFASFPTTGETGKIYIAKDTGVIYRWSGSIYIEISNPLDLATTADAQAGTNTTKAMTPARTKEAIEQFVDSTTYDNHIADTTIHFTQAQISITESQISDLGSYEPANANIQSHISSTTNPHSVTKDQVGLGNVTNEAQIPLTQKGANNGVAELDASGKVPAQQLPSYVDDVLEFANVGAFPTVGETGKIYVALDTGKIYRWSGSAYVEISASLVPNDGTLTIAGGTALTGSGTFSADQSTNETITINADIATQQEAEAGTATDKLMTPEKTKQHVDNRIKYLTTTIATTDWSGSEPATAVKTVSGLLNTDKPLIDIDLSSVTFANVEAKQTEYAKIFRVAATDTNEITFFALEAPTEELVIQIKVVR